MLKKMVNWSKSRYVQDMKNDWILAVHSIATVATISGLVALFVLKNSHYKKTGLFDASISILLPSFIVGYLTDNYYQDYLDRVWLEEYKKGNHE